MFMVMVAFEGALFATKVLLLIYDLSGKNPDCKSMHHICYYHYFCYFLRHFQKVYITMAFPELSNYASNCSFGSLSLYFVLFLQCCSGCAIVIRIDSFINAYIYILIRKWTHWFWCVFAKLKKEAGKINQLQIAVKGNPSFF